MTWNFPAFSGIFFLGTALALILAIVGWIRRPAPGTVPFILFTLAVAEWSLTRAFEAGAVGLSAKVFWGKTEYFGIASVGVLFLSFAMDFAGISAWRRRRVLALLWAVPVVSLILAWTNEWHGLIWPSITPTPGTDGAILTWAHGPWFWFMTVFQYSVLLAGIIILLRLAATKSGIYRQQVVILLIGTLVPIIGNIIYILGLSPVQGLDLTPFAFTLAAAVYGLTIFHYRLLDLVPIARSTVIESMSDGILVLDELGRLVEINPAAEKMLGLAAGKSLGKRISEIWGLWADVVKSGVADSGKAELSTDSNGQKAYLDLTITPLPGRREGTTGGRLIVVRDVSERRRMEQALREEIERRNNYTRALVHELKTPLTAIIASSDLLTIKISKTHRDHLIQSIRRSALNLDSRINELLDLARGEIGMLKVKPIPLDLLCLLRDTVQDMRPVVESKGLYLTLEAAENLPLAQAEEARLRQVLNNLISNAVKFTPTGGITLRAREDAGAMLLVQVIDTGYGIERQDLDRIFDPYWQRSRDPEMLSGLGVGLALCKIFVELHHGRIWAESQPGKGTTFSFTVPVSRDGE